MRYEQTLTLDVKSFEVTPDSGEELVSAAEIRLKEMSVISELLYDLKLAHLPSYEHCLRVGEVASRLADNETEAEDWFVYGVLHDIGKSYSGIPDILEQPAELTPGQIDIVKQHSQYGRDLILKAKEKFPNDSGEHQLLSRAAFIAQYHHEPLDFLNSMQPNQNDEVLDENNNELKYRVAITQFIRLFDQLDARTDISRPYLLAEKSRQNIGVQRTPGGSLVVSPDELWSEITNELYGVNDFYNHNLFARQIFNTRFGGKVILD